MARTTSTQRGASRRTDRSASTGSAARKSPSSRSRKPSSAPRGRKPVSARPRARRPIPTWAPIAVGVFAVLFAWSLYPALQLDYQASRSLAGVEQQRDSLKQRNDAARKEIGALQTPQGVEKKAREDLGLAKPGENVYVVVPSTPATRSQAGAAGTSAASVATAPTPSLLQAVLDAVFGVAQPSTTIEP